LQNLKAFLKKHWYIFFVCIIVIFGIYLRLKGLLTNPSMWHDECALGWNIKFRTYGELFGKLRFLQVAPPFFMVATKFLVALFNADNKFALCDMIMRLIPFVCGSASIWVFYLLAKEVFTKKSSVLIALFLFSINGVLINYSYEFKPYSSDVLAILALSLFFIKLDLSKIGYKKLSVAACAMALALWFSFVSVFTIAAGFLTLIFKRKEFKKILMLFLPTLISTLLYFKFYLLATYQDNGVGMADFWAKEFISPDLSNFFPLLVENIKYFFAPAKAILFVIILLVYGLILFYKNKKYDFLNVSIIAFVGLISASALHIYPFSGRLVLFLVPFFILYTVQPIENFDSTKKIKSFFIFVLFIAICLPQIQSTFKNMASSVNKGDFSKEMMVAMEKDIKKKDKIFVNKGSLPGYEYYSSFYKISNEIFRAKSDDISQGLPKTLNNLPAGYYWLYLPYDFSPQRNTINYIKFWAQQNTELIHITEATQSALIYVHIK